MSWAPRCPSLKRILMMRWMTMMVMIWVLVPYLEECHAASLLSPDQAADSPPSGSGQVAAFAADPELEGTPGSPSGSSGEVGTPEEEAELARNDPREEDANSAPTTEIYSGDVLAQEDATGQQSETVTPSKRDEPTGYPVTDSLVDDASSAKEKVSESQPAAITVSRGRTTTPTTRPEPTLHGTSDDAKKNEDEVSEGYSRTPDIGRNSDDDSTEDNTLKKNETTTERSRRTTPWRDSENQTPSSSVGAESSAPVTDNQTFRTVLPGTTPQSPQSSAEESVTSLNTPGSDSPDEASLTNASNSETKETLVTLQSETPSIRNAYTFSKPPSDELTTAEDIFTKQMESSEMVKTAPGFKVTSDQLFVSGSRKPTQRHTRSTNGLTLQHTTADFSSTVPSNAAESTSVEMSSTVRSSGTSSGMTSEQPSTVTMPTTSVTTELPETSTSARLGMKCLSDESCAEVGSHAMCLQGVCQCQSGYHGDVLKNACIREPHSLAAEEGDNTCVNIQWQGGGDEYNVTVTSSVPDDENRSERMMNTWGKFCQFSPGSNLTVSVRLSSGGTPATSWAVLKPSSAENVEISSVNETCVTATWRRGVGYTQYYNLTMQVVVSSEITTVSDTTADSQWTRCNLVPGSKFSLQVQAFSHGKNSQKSAFLKNSTVPSQPREGRAERSQSDPRRCVSLQWIPGPGVRDHFYIPEHVDKTETPSATVCRLRPGSHHTFNIFAFSDPRSSKPLVLEACTDPNKVQSLREEQIDATWASLSWDPPSKGNADRYIIRGNNSDEPVVTDRTTATVVGLSSGTTYAVSVTAEFCNRTSRPFFVIFTTKFSALTSVNVSAMGTVLEVFWESDQKKEVPVELIVTYKNETVFKEVVYTSPRTVQTNRSGACFNVSLRVVNSTQVQTTVQATEPAAPEEVQNLQAQRLTNERRSISVTWWPPAVANGVVAFYNVSAQGLRGFRQTNRLQDCQQDCSLDCHAPDQMMSDAYLPSADTATNYSVVLDELSEYENYIVTVTAFTSAGEGLPSSVRVEGQLLDSVSELDVEELNSTCLRLTWSYPANADADAQGIHYLLQYQEDAVEEARKPMEKNVTDTHCLLCGLQYWTDYRVNITAVNGEGPGRTDTRLRRTGEHVPGVVSNVMVSPETSIHKPRQLEVTWSAPVHPYGIILSYFVTVRDRNTSEVEERRHTPQSRRKRAVDGRPFKETFGLVGDHHYHVQVFGATGAGNGSRAHTEVVMPAGVLPPSGETVHFNPDTIEVTSLLVDIPASLLCNFTYGLPVHAGYIVYRPEHPPSGISQETSPGPRPMVTTPWSPAHTPFFVQMDVRAQCARVAAHGKSLSVRLGHKECGQTKGGGGGGGAQRPSSPAPDTCGGPLQPNTRYRLLLVFCTSAACRYTQPAPAFTTRPQPDESGSDTAGLAAGLTVVFLLLLLGGPAAFYWVYRKKQARSGPVILPQPTQDTECREIICRSRPVALDVFVDHVQLLHRDSNLGFSDEYKTIKDHSPYYSVRASELPPCKPKNRYMNILPWDQSRVKLIPTDDEEGSDYINANYLPGENHQREFIAAQGPLPGTVDDFWRMVWENRVCVMVMLTQCIEKGKTKCERYWPDEGVQTIYGDLVVQVRSQSVLPDYIIRVIDIKLGNQSRMIKHFHFMRWPDHGCPERTSMLLNFVSSVRAHMPHSGAGPTLVHCSAGVGRTGTFIALDRLLLQIRQNSQVDIFGLVFEMREHRMQMVQTENQYVYIHDCLADALTKDRESDDEQSDSEEEHIYGNC